MMKDVDSNGSNSSLKSDDETKYKSGLPSKLPCGLVEEGSHDYNLMQTGRVDKMIIRKQPSEKYALL